MVTYSHYSETIVAVVAWSIRPGDSPLGPANQPRGQANQPNSGAPARTWQCSGEKQREQPSDVLGRSGISGSAQLIREEKTHAPTISLITLIGAQNGVNHSVGVDTVYITGDGCIASSSTEFPHPGAVRNQTNGATSFRSLPHMEST